jgi:hypothetical protein
MKNGKKNYIKGLRGAGSFLAGGSRSALTACPWAFGARRGRAVWPVGGWFGCRSGVVRLRFTVLSIVENMGVQKVGVVGASFVAVLSIL